MERKMVLTALLFGVIAIVLGAFGAHALKKVLSTEQLIAFETGVKYQMYHTLFLLFVGTTTLVTEKAKRTILYLVVLGVLFFSGSIYLLATNDLTSIDFRAIGFITPIGGLFLIGAWLFTFIAVINNKR
ncbi:DUF423 domain-containing protein [Flavobacterium luteum]|uniref:DUF423 domain-containing protein n=1 Tax=Flavobacterium luteum TaxID=2026654 RepID=A0A7J5AI82_9FLAO|nr:DUF423 domain-containing protein [Flavobacterium luteum]KAB1156719.1 DUF423 domain-containing protein [Flavobacterium luteum]